MLIVDDDPEVRERVADVLAQAGFGTLAAADGAEGYALAAEHRPGAIVLDVMMPGMDGYTLFTQLRGDPTTRPIPVVILTGQAAPIYRTLSLGTGAAAHVTKPFLPGVLTSTLRRVLDASGAA